MNVPRTLAVQPLLVVLALVAAGCAADEGSGQSSVASAPGTTAVGDTAPSTVAADTTTPVVTAPLVEGSVVLTPYIDGFQAPVDIAWRAGDPTLYIVDQPGVITPVVDGVPGAAVLDIRDLVTYGGEQGLLGLAFHPTDSLAYVNYTNKAGNTSIDEFVVGADGVFDVASRRVVMTIEDPYPNHNGGDLVFGPDGMLYIGMGDGGSGGDPERRAMNLGEPFGKMMRIDPRASGDHPYTVPADNPFVGVDGARPEIWSIGLRNPWRYSFDRETGDLWIADVGQGDWEEVDVVLASDGTGRGANFGWSALEGTHTYNSDQSAEGATPPIYEYSHGEGCSISGGALYRGEAIPSLRGWFLFGDFCNGKVYGLLQVPGAAPIVLTLGNVGSVSAVVDGPNGELYVLAYNSGSIFRIDPAV